MTAPLLTNRPQMVLVWLPIYRASLHSKAMKSEHFALHEGDQRPHRFFDQPGNSFFSLEKRAYSLE
jgi:hypothetical protein